MNVKRIEREVIGIPTLDAKKYQDDYDGRDPMYGDSSKFRSLNINGVIEKKTIGVDKKEKRYDQDDRWITKVKVYHIL
jgi:hypothetical protein